MTHASVRSAFTARARKRSLLAKIVRLGWSVATGVLTACSASGYITVDAKAMRDVPPVPAPLAQEVVSQFYYVVNLPASPDPFADSPTSPKESPLQIVKTGRDVGPVQGRPTYAFKIIRNPPLNQPLTAKDFAPVSFNVDVAGSLPVLKSYDGLTPEQVEGIHSVERAMAGAELAASVASSAISLALQAERNALLSDATLRRRMVLESGAINAHAPQSRRLALYYQIVQTGKGRTGEYSMYIGCVAQLQDVDADASAVTIDGEAYGVHGISWFGSPKVSRIPDDYVDPKASGVALHIVDERAHPLTQFVNPIWQPAYAACRVATNRLAARHR